jgi:hypothetical protein
VRASTLWHEAVVRQDRADVAVEADQLSAVGEKSLAAAAALATTHHAVTTKLPTHNGRDMF